MILKSALTKEFYKTGDVAKMVGLSSRSIYKYCNQGDITGVVINNKQRLIPKESVIDFLTTKGLLLDDSNNKKDVIYARVSTHKQKNSGDLDRQIQELMNYAITKNLKILKLFLKLQVD